MLRKRKRRMHTQRGQAGDDVRIPDSIIVEAFNKHMGTNLSSTEEAFRYIDANPEERKLLSGLRIHFAGWEFTFGGTPDGGAKE